MKAKATRSLPARPRPARAAVRLPARQAPVLGMRPGLVQPLLRVGAADDPMEREAEQNAARITAMTAPPLADARPAGNGRASAAPLRRAEQPSLDELAVDPPMPANLAEPTVAPAENVPLEKVDPGDMAEIEAGTPAETGGEGALQPDRADGAGAAVGPEGGPAPADVAARVAAPGPGRPLPEDLRAFVEPRFGTSFGDVRLHDQDADREAAARIGARAFTHGQHIWLGPGERAQDRALMAHELTHVVQQTGRRTGEAPTGRLLARDQAPVRRGYIADKIDKYARHVPGYTLLCVIIGKSPITGNKVERNAVNLIGGLMGLIPGGTLLFDRLQEARVVERAYQWVVQRLAELDLSWARIERALDGLLRLRNITSPIASVKKWLGPIFRDIATFAGDVKDKLLELIIQGALALAGPLGQRVWEVFQEAREAIRLVLDDPIGFVKNLFKAIGKGFAQFKTNIVEHLKRGLLTWLLGPIAEAGIELPSRLDLKGILSLGLQVVGLTWRGFRGDLVKELDPHGQMKVGFLEQAIDVIRTLVAEGFAGIWRKMLEMVDNFKTIVIEGIKSYVRRTIVEQAIAWLASLSNPIGGVIRILKAAYDIICVFIERFEQILAVARSIFSSVKAIAQGAIQNAADFIEGTMARTIPLMISFLAGLLSLNGIPTAIKNIIQRIQAPVVKARQRFAKFLVKKSKKLLSGIIARLNKLRKPKGTPFRFMNVEHEMIAEKKGRKLELMIASRKPKPENQVQAEIKSSIKTAQQKGDKNEALAPTDKVAATEIDQAAAATAKVEPESTTVNQRQNAEKASTESTDAADKLSQASTPLENDPYLDPKHPDFFVRAIEPRPVGQDGQPIEGRGGKYGTLKDLVKQKARGTGGNLLTTYYEIDHLPAEALLKEVAAKLAQIEAPDAPAKPKDGAGGDAVLDQAKRDGEPEPPPAPATTAAAPEAASHFKTLGADAAGRETPRLNAIILYHEIHGRKSGATNAGIKAAKDQIQAAITASPESKAKRINAVVQLLKARATMESDVVAKAVEGDKNATVDIRKQITTGMAAVMDANRQDFNLEGEAKEVKTEGVAKTAAGRNELSFGQIAAEGDAEGTVKPYGDFGTRGAHTEADHVLDRSFPKSVIQEKASGGAARKFGDEDLTDKLGIDSQRLVPAALEGDERTRAVRRVAQLRGTELNSSAGPLPRGYDENKAETMLLYRPLANRVTARVGNNNAWKAFTARFGPAQRAALEGYVLDKVDMSVVRQSFKGPVREVLQQQFQRHMSIIVGEYRSEIPRVLAANADPKRKEAAQKKMDQLLASIGGEGKAKLEGDVQKLF